MRDAPLSEKDKLSGKIGVCLLEQTEIPEVVGYIKETLVDSREDVRCVTCQYVSSGRTVFHKRVIYI